MNNETPDLLKTKKVQSSISKFFTLQSSASRLARSQHNTTTTNSNSKNNNNLRTPEETNIAITPIVTTQIIVPTNTSESLLSPTPIPSQHPHQQQQQQQQSIDNTTPIVIGRAVGGYVQTPGSTALVATFAVSVSNEDEQQQQHQQQSKQQQQHKDTIDLDDEEEKQQKSKRHVVTTRLTVKFL